MTTLSILQRRITKLRVTHQSNPDQKSVGQSSDSEFSSDHIASDDVLMSSATRDESEFASASNFRLCESPTLTAGEKT